MVAQILDACSLQDSEVSTRKRSHNLVHLRNYGYRLYLRQESVFLKMESCGYERRISAVFSLYYLLGDILQD